MEAKDDQVGRVRDDGAVVGEDEMIYRRGMPARPDGECARVRATSRS